MELDELKHIINSNVSPTSGLQEKDFSRLDKWKSLHPTEKIKHKVLYENLLGLLLSLILITVLLVYNNEIASIIDFTALSIIAISLVYGFYFFLKLQKLIAYDGPTKDFLINFNKTIKGYIKILTLTALFFAPISFYLGYIFGYSLGSDLDINNVLHKFIDKPKYLITATIIAIPVTYGIYRLIKFAYHKLYGKHIAEIEKLINEFNID